MKITIEPYINFDGNAEEAFLFYQKAFNAPEPHFMRFKDVPKGDAEDWEEADGEGIMHASLNLGPLALMGSDTLPGQYTKPSNIYISWAADDLEEVKRVWQVFVDGGSEVEMDLEKTFWSELYGILKDPYGVGWMIMHYDPNMTE